MISYKHSRRYRQKYVVCGPLVQQTFGHKADHVVYVIFQESFGSLYVAIKIYPPVIVFVPADK